MNRIAGLLFVRTEQVNRRDLIKSAIGMSLVPVGAVAAELGRDNPDRPEFDVDYSLFNNSVLLHSGKI